MNLFMPVLFYYALCFVVSAYAGDVLDGGHPAPIAMQSGFSAGPPVPLGPLPRPIPVRDVEEHFVIGAEYFPSSLHVAVPPAPLAVKAAPIGAARPAHGYEAAGHSADGAALSDLGEIHAVAGSSYLVSTVHHVQKVSHGGKYLGQLRPTIASTGQHLGKAGKVGVVAPLPASMRLSGPFAGMVNLGPAIAHAPVVTPIQHRPW